jgi:amino acid permease
VKERISEQINHELKQASRTETTVTIIAIVVTFILFGMAAGFASSSVGFSVNSLIGLPAPNPSLNAYMVASLFVSLIAIFVINLYSIFAIRNSMTKKVKLAENLDKLNQEEGAAVYSAADVSSIYKNRGRVFTAIVATIGSIGIIIPLIIFINKIVEDL